MASFFDKSSDYLVHKKKITIRHVSFTRFAIYISVTTERRPFTTVLELKTGIESILIH